MAAAFHIEFVIDMKFDTREKSTNFPIPQDIDLPINKTIEYLYENESNGVFYHLCLCCKCTAYIRFRMKTTNDKQGVHGHRLNFNG